MSLTERFSAITDFLLEHRYFWEEEVLTRYPSAFDHFPDEWLEDLNRLDFEQLYRVEKAADYTLLRSDSLRRYFSRSRSVVHIERAPLSGRPASEKVAPPLLFGVSGKKQHEIEILCEFLSALHDKGELAAVADYAGGVGYLAQVLTCHCRIPTRTFDSDERLQQRGRERFANLRRNFETASLDYVNCDLEKEAEAAADGRELSLGLHTCGSLSAILLSAAAAASVKAVLNFGCCYYRTAAKHLFLSQAARQRRLNLTPPALTLATRSHRDSERGYFLSKRVKQFRYTMHLYLYHELGLKDFVSLGNSPRRLYADEFSHYALEQLERLGTAARPRAEELNSFYADEKHRSVVRRMITANIIRAQAGRPLEVYLLLDRALMMEEHGYKVSVSQYFDELLSPRNIGIFACK